MRRNSYSAWLALLIAGCGVDGVQPFGGGGANVLGIGAGGEAGHVMGGAAGSVGGAAGGAGGAGQTGAGGSPVINTCTNGKLWTSGDDGAHRPGSPCGSCHSSFTASGTIFSTADEPTNCYGVDGAGLTITITGADHSGRSLRVNEAGNFWTMAPLVFPIKIGISNEPGSHVSMKSAADHGDCNACHVSGMRILPPI